MGNNDEMEQKLLKLKEEFETYQNFAENTIQIINEKNNRLEKNLDALTNIVEISKYINSNISDKNLIPMINDMVLGILGVTYSSIYILNDEGELEISATNIENKHVNLKKYEIETTIKNKEPFVVNSKEPIFSLRHRKVNIHSIIGAPIFSRGIFKGYIVVEHELWNFFSQDHIAFVSSITNHIGIALENNFLYNKVKESSITDPLLGIYNRRYFFEYIEGRVKQNPEEKFAMIMVDIDNFKKFNDKYGHQFGDKVLIETSNVLRKNIGQDDFIARYGGEEIVIYIRNVNSYGDMFAKIDYLREKLSNHVIEYRDEKKSVTASFGISYYPENGDTVQKVLSVADSMLYVAKNSGRNRVINSITEI
jgi:diguanylate cyclase (GGDEF)-like protein